jgi:prepilin-type processing-associated H-X9-DG protein
VDGQAREAVASAAVFESHESFLPYRRGPHLRSNYFYVDGHVDNATPKNARDALDPWDVRKER